MNEVTVGVGAAAILYGFYTLYLHLTSRRGFGKLTAMRETWGRPLGTLIHFVAYTVVPLVFGFTMLLRGLGGKPLF